MRVERRRIGGEWGALSIAEVSRRDRVRFEKRQAEARLSAWRSRYWRRESELFLWQVCGQCSGHDEGVGDRCGAFRGGIGKGAYGSRRRLSLRSGVAAIFCRQRKAPWRGAGRGGSHSEG